MSADEGSLGVVRSVFVVSKIESRRGTRIAAELGQWLEQRGVAVRYDAETSTNMGRDDGFPRDEPPADADLAIVTGGDGTLLSVARSAGPLGLPILGVNFGGLGFLTELQPDELYIGLEAVLAGRTTIEQRQILRVRHHRGGELCDEWAVLNDAVITKSALARMIVIDVRADGDEVASYTSDGLIVATPTGSTAYNLSAGGPILDPRMSALVIAPICPHTMTYRPLVVPGSVRLEVGLQPGDEEVYLTLDGQIGFPFDAEDSLEIDLHPSPAKLVRVSGRSFFEVLRRKLRWGAR